MVNLDEVNAEIARLEAQELSYQTISKLADLYTVREHSRITQTDGTDFLKLCAGRNVKDVIDLFDELMSALMVMQPKMYDAVIRRLTTI